MKIEDIVKLDIDDEILSMVLSLESSIDLCRGLSGRDVGEYLRKAAVLGLSIHLWPSKAMV